MAVQNQSTYESNRHNSQKSLNQESVEKTPKVSIRQFYTNPPTDEVKIVESQSKSTMNYE